MSQWFRSLRIVRNSYQFGRFFKTSQSQVSAVSAIKRAAFLLDRKPLWPSYLLFCYCVVKAGSKMESGNTETYEKADKLHADKEFEALYKLLVEFKDSKDVELLWRLTRATYEMSKESSNEEEAKRLMREADGYITKALELDEGHFCTHKWKAIVLNFVSGYEGTKVKIQNSFIIKQHMEKAIELNPTDGISNYLLGCWCFEVSELPWIQRKAAAVLFATPPTSTYEEALGHFLRAEEVAPNNYSMNFVMIGKCYLRLKKKAEAKEFLLKAQSYPGSSRDDKEAKETATTLLKSL